VQRVGVYGYFGQSPTYFLTQTVNGTTTKLQARGNKSFSRVGAYGWWFLQGPGHRNLFMLARTMHSGQREAANDPGSLPAGAAGPSWNGGFVEAH